MIINNIPILYIKKACVLEAEPERQADSYASDLLRGGLRRNLGWEGKQGVVEGSVPCTGILSKPVRNTYSQICLKDPRSETQGSWAATCGLTSLLGDSD